MIDKDYEKEQDHWALWHIVSIPALVVIGFLLEFL
jgi:uncharacterized membrane protein